MAFQWIKLFLFMTVILCVLASDFEIQEKRGSPTIADVMKELTKVKRRLLKLESQRLVLLKGRDGRDGAPGQPGRRGKDGAQGPRGRSGEKGLTGRKGQRGPPGKRSGGTAYIRWGKTSCPVGAEFVYRGRIGGEHYTHTGGGSKYVCLPEIPKYDRYKPGSQGGAYMYGTEYDVSGRNLFSKSYLHDHEAPCVACHVRSRNSKLMIPATNECPSNWHREYRGYLMGGHASNKHSVGFICVDVDAEAVSGTKPNVNGALLYPVEGKCGSLPCYPYVEGRELTCAVCTK